MKLIFILLLGFSFVSLAGPESESHKKFRQKVEQAIREKKLSRCNEVNEFTSEDMGVGKEAAADWCFQEYAHKLLDLAACKKIKTQFDREQCLEIVEKVKLAVAAKDVALCDKYFNKGSPRAGICLNAFKK